MFSFLRVAAALFQFAKKQGGLTRMHRLLSISNDGVTRDLKLENIDTKRIDVCFDDSMTVSINNTFEFMQIGEVYDCKIALFGDTENRHIGEWNKYVILQDNIKIRDETFVKVSLENNIYYIYQEQVLPYLTSGDFMFECIRKDLIQVNDMINRDLYKLNRD